MVHLSTSGYTVVASLAALIATTLQPILLVEASTYYHVSQAPSCTNGVSFDAGSFQADCRNGYNCLMGDELSVKGSISLPSAAPSPACIVSKICFMGVSAACKSYTNKNVDVCEAIDATGTNGLACPNADTFSFSTQVTLPEDDGGFGGSSGWWGSGWWLEVESTVASDCDDIDSTTYTVCSTTIKAVSGASTYRLAYSSSAFAFLGILGLAVLGSRRRRRLQLEQSTLSDGRSAGLLSSDEKKSSSIEMDTVGARV
jgi:MYXO-CTERM domain-containing protein